MHHKVCLQQVNAVCWLWCWFPAGRLVLLMATADDIDQQQAYSSGSGSSS
jgi:hypothetical protein